MSLRSPSGRPLLTRVPRPARRQQPDPNPSRRTVWSSTPQALLAAAVVSGLMLAALSNSKAPTTKYCVPAVLGSVRSTGSSCVPLLHRKPSVSLTKVLTHHPLTRLQPNRPQVSCSNLRAGALVRPAILRSPWPPREPSLGSFTAGCQFVCLPLQPLELLLSRTPCRHGHRAVAAPGPQHAHVDYRPRLYERHYCLV